MARGRKKRLNIYFRQTSKALRASRQTQIFSHINRNLPYKLYSFSRNQFRKSRKIIRTYVDKNQVIFVLKDRKELKQAVKKRKKK
jgi:hypothetical protein